MCTGMGVYRAMISGSSDRRSGLRCVTITIAQPGSGGRLPKTDSNASSPPAEAPIPTMANGESFHSTSAM